jgi:hypothetical protein
LSTVGSKLDLAARALIAQEQGIPPRSDLKEKEKELSSYYNQLLKIHNINEYP